tara:strand:- start:442 stop:609 length:168 start_codon:yes stop_codon:yes gene_type:complete
MRESTLQSVHQRSLNSPDDTGEVITVRKPAAKLFIFSPHSCEVVKTVFFHALLET